MESKKCRKCNTIKHVSFFSKSGLDSHGNQYYRPDCKECRKPVIKEYIEANKDKINAKNSKRITCECGCTSRRDKISQHKKSSCHQKLIEEKKKLKRNLTDEELDIFFPTNYTFKKYPKGILITSDSQTIYLKFLKTNYYYIIYNYNIIISISSTGLYGSATIVNSDLFNDVEALKEQVTTLSTSYLTTTQEHRDDISQNRLDISQNRLDISSKLSKIKINDISNNRITAIEQDITPAPNCP
jgi:hypothetical protein